MQSGGKGCEKLPERFLCHSRVQQKEKRLMCVADHPILLFPVVWFDGLI